MSNKKTFIWIIVTLIVLSFISFVYFTFIQYNPSLTVKIILSISWGFTGFAVSYFFFYHYPQIKFWRNQSRGLIDFSNAIKRVASTLDLQEILDSSAKIITEILGVRGCLIKLLDPKS